MSSFSKTITSNGSLQLIRKYQEHKQPITGLIEAGGSFGGGVLGFFLSLSDGDNILPWNDLTGTQFQINTAETREFNLPVVSMNSGQMRIYYTLTGATNPNITLTIGDNT